LIQFLVSLVYTDKMALFQFGGGQAVGLPASNEQAVSEIAESLGLGVGQYLNKKKIQMLGNPVDYLTNCNNALAAVAKLLLTPITPS